MKSENGFGDNGFEAWGGYMQAKIAKLEEQFSAGAKKEELKSNILNGISIYVNGYTKPSADELKLLMARHGGVYHTYQRSDDYIISTNLASTKIRKMSLTKVVKPEWITESIASGELLDYRNYLLYGTSRAQTKIAFANHSPETSTSEKKAKERETSCTEMKLYKPCDVKTAVDPNFITEFYNNSRLHHISQLGAHFKQYINNLIKTSNFCLKARYNLKEKRPESKFENNFNGKIVMHIDMDCFFVSVALRRYPELVGKPVAVTHSHGRQAQVNRTGVNREAEFNLYKERQAKKLSHSSGIPAKEILTNIKTRVDNIGSEDDKYGSMSEIASCSYEARAKGIKNGMFMGSALRLCPDLIPIPYDFDAYQNVAHTLYDTVAQYTLDIEAVSCDEMYVDCLELLSSTNISVEDFATLLRNEIRLKTGCPCSTGFGSNRLQARLATKKAKPNGQFFLYGSLVTEFMKDIHLADLPGVGRQTTQKLHSLGYTTCGSMQDVPLNVLQKHLGNKTGKLLFEQCRGEDSTPLTFYNIRKSVSAEVNYGIRFDNEEQCKQFLKQLSTEVHRRLSNLNLIGKCITLKLMVRAEDAPVETAKFMGHGFCNVINKSVTLSRPTDDADIICQEVIGIVNKLKVEPKEMRGIGIQVTKLENEDSKSDAKSSINKYFITNKEIQTKTSVSSGIESNQISKLTSDTEGNTQDTVIEQTDIKTLSNVNQQVFKSPVKKRGRPPKLTSPRVLEQTSRSIIRKFLNSDLQKKHTDKEKFKEEPIDYKCLDQDSNVSQSESQSDLVAFPSYDMKNLLKAWLSSSQPPLECDVQAITMYLKQMVLRKNLNTLVILLKMLQRITIEINHPIWLDTSEKIIKEVQNTMLTIYGKRLYL